MDPVQIFFVLLLAGLLLFGAEVFVPGGVLGVIGAVCLVGAIIAGFIAFPAYGGYIAVCIMLLVGVSIVLWIKIFPKTRIGKRMTVFANLATSKASDDTSLALMDKEGDALSDLRPAGFARIDGRRVDVLTRGEMVPKGSHVKVVHVEGNRVFVTKIDET